MKLPRRSFKSKARFKPHVISYADVKSKPLKFQVRDKVMLKVPPWKRVIRFGKRGNLNPRYIEPFEVAAKVRTVTYRLELPQQLSRVHSIFHVSNLKTCLSDESLAISLDVIQIDDKLHFVEEPVEVMDREVKRLKQSRIPIVRVDGPLEEVQSSRRNVKKNFKTSIRTSSPTPLRKATQAELRDKIILTGGDCDNPYFQCLKKTRYAVSGKVDTAYWAGFLGVRATFKSISDIIPNLLDLLYLRIVIFMDTAYVDNMDTPY
ncbi:hypothetical protein Tco_1316513 [Tanacetum coccineum]